MNDDAEKVNSYWNGQLIGYDPNERLYSIEVCVCLRAAYVYMHICAIATAAILTFVPLVTAASSTTAPCTTPLTSLKTLSGPSKSIRSITSSELVASVQSPPYPLEY